MTVEQETLLALLRVGMDQETREDDWSTFDFSRRDIGELIREAARQGVTGVAWAGYERVHGALEKDAQLPPAEKLQWYVAAGSVEKGMKKRWAAAVAFANELAERGGVRCVVLKGIDYARLYPNPAYREFGDLDCWLKDEAEKGDEIAKEIGAYLDAGDYKHSHLRYHGLTIENHRCFSGHGFTPNGLRVERLLSRLMATEPCRTIEGTNLFSPPPAFTAVFMLRHACGHFLAEGIRLRLILDWALFLRLYSETARSETVMAALRETRLLPFAELLTAFSVRYLGLSPEAFPYTSVNERRFEAFTADLFRPGASVFDRRTHVVAGRILRRFRRMWRFRAYLDEAYLRKVRTTFEFSRFLKTGR